MLPAEVPMRFLVVFLTVLGAVVFSVRSTASTARLKGRWKRIASLPFATADPPRLPYFAALRDA